MGEELLHSLWLTAGLLVGVIAVFVAVHLFAIVVYSMVTWWTREYRDWSRRRRERV